MNILDGVDFHFDEIMSGFIGVGHSDPSEGSSAGKRAGTSINFDAHIFTDDIGKLVSLSNHETSLEGVVKIDSLGGTFEMRDGTFNLFSIEPDTGVSQMIYKFNFIDSAGDTFFVRLCKEVRNDPGFDIVEDSTVGQTFIYKGEDDSAPIYAAGIMVFNLSDLPKFISSMRTEGDFPVWKKLAAKAAFASFYYGVMRDEYLDDFRAVYDTRYDNFVLSGMADVAGEERQFFLVSGKHDRGFPWGDGEIFWDVLLVYRDGNDWKRLCITRRVLDELEIDFETGRYYYKGPLFVIKNGYQTSFSEIANGDSNLEQVEVTIDLRLELSGAQDVSIPFPTAGKLLSKLSGSFLKSLREILPSENLLGLWISLNGLKVLGGTIDITSSGGTSVSLKPLPDTCFAEGENSTLRNIKEPTLLYGYICAPMPDRQSARVQIHTRTLRDEKERWIKDRLDSMLGEIISRVASAELLWNDGKVKTKKLHDNANQGELISPIGDPILEVNNDHFPTAVFQRRIILVKDPNGKNYLALEEDMTRLNCAPVDSDREVTVAAYKNPDKFAALKRVLDDTGFDDKIASELSSSGKDISDFLVAIKPNFMFAYNKKDHTTYTDPDLVAHLVARLKALGYEKIVVVEAQSTYGKYFDRRSVADVASYLGYESKVGCKIVDLTKDIDGEQQFGPHLGLHPVSRTWRDADFRVSFAKNKTHSYAYYTLSLKNIYGTLPLADKLKEYHSKRDIYHTTIEYMTAFPVHFGLIDASVSADGPFGIFADLIPNKTNTIIGGGDLVAVDWVGATKMGIDPQLSKYMRLAVKAFGKPRINFKGNANAYRPWLNVPPALTDLTNDMIDGNYLFANIVYSSCAEMDTDYFRYKDRNVFIKFLRKLTTPLRRTFFIRAGEKQTKVSRIVNWLLYKLGY